ncbi:MAG: hypothetical protein F6J95_001790 [Leptolyngbya sp. SIO1E4]|nr:hypothetical protein [Leptolyngbya sp. SIO1E4]
MPGDLATTALSTITALVTAPVAPIPDAAPLDTSILPGPSTPPSVLLAGPPNRPIQLIDRVVDGSDFDEFRDRLWQAIQQRDTAFMYELLPSEGIFIGDEGPVPPEMLALEDPNSLFWHSLEKMLAPQSCELEDYPGTLPDSAVWGCPNIASALQPQPAAPETAEPQTADRSQVVVVGRRVNVRARPELGTSVVGKLSNEVVEFDQITWQELMRTAPETTDNPIDGWTPVILPNQIQGYVYNRYVYHPQGPRALFEHIDGRWQLLRIVISEELSMVP